MTEQNMQQHLINLICNNITAALPVGTSVCRLPFWDTQE